MRRYLHVWPFLAFILVPVVVAVVDAAVLINEQRQSETEKAIRLVRESKSRKENFTVQQYLYTTVYYRKSQGEDVAINGWSAEQPSGPGTPFIVEFSFTDGDGRRSARWRVQPGDKVAIPLDEVAGDLSWH
ncbi:MAG TPA: hypothetical protein VNH22_00220 [Blastocatellia bacterium]|jgi:hypothetical protein|nr:hypothetical protein [Blastocatellia bacterium]